MTSSSPGSASIPSSVLEAVKGLVRLDTTSASGNIDAIELLRDILQAKGVTTHVFREDTGIDANLVAVFPARGESAGESTDQMSRAVLGERYGVGLGGINQLGETYQPGGPIQNTGAIQSSGPPQSESPVQPGGPIHISGAADASPRPASPSPHGEPRGILITGHADCVPVAGQTWTSPPFEPEVRDGKLFGRGTADMKSYLGVFAGIAERFLEADLAEPVYFTATWDEETSCNGARELVKQLEYLGIRPRIAYVGEPTSMQVITAHKSMNAFEADFRGIAAHSSLLSRGLNANRYAAEFTTWFHTEIVDAMVRDGEHDEAFPVPHFTGGVNLMECGNALNTVPALAHLECEFRALPRQDAVGIAKRIVEKIEEIDAEMKAAVPADPADASQAAAVGAELRIRSLLHPLDAGWDGPAVRFAREIGVTVSDEKVTYGTEAGIFQAAGMSAVVIGPGDIAQAHGANEFVELQQLEECERFFAALLDALKAA